VLTPKLEDLLPLKAQAKALKNYSKIASHDSLSGNLKTKLKGQGLEFHQVRQYVAGDEIRNIDWRVTARTGKAHVKEFIEEKESNIDIICEVGPNMQFASHGKFKYLLAAEIVALLGFAAEQNKESLTSIFFGENLAEPKVIRQKNQKSIILQILNFLCLQKDMKLSNANNNLLTALKALNSGAKKQGVCFIIATNIEVSKELQLELQKLRLKKQVFIIQLIDNLDKDLPAAGKISFSDYNNRKITIDLSDKKARSSYKSAFNQRLKALEKLCSELGVKLFNINTTDDVLKSLVLGIK